MKTIIKNIKNYFVSTKYFLKKEFITELYYKHFLYSMVLALLPLYILTNYFHLGTTPFLFQCFIGGFCCFIVNGIREAIKENQAKKIKHIYPFDWIDIYFGSYGGIIATVIIYFINLF